jgi:hypothetical protein
LKILTTNTAKFAGGSELSKTYREIIQDIRETDEDKQEAQQEAQDVINTMKNKLKGLRARG